ncbi:unnamed protein product [Pocillopora meandrina]|uniref:Uncharacterized protein n=1 Tax=Pocillopora meandrina TaxID=46732 RepID=A0AAU9X0Y6_9CNID|nr:unnamed protein product [Pocillopora meandrina]
MDTIQEGFQNFNQIGGNWRFQTLNPVNKDPQRITKLHKAQSEQLSWSNINFIMKLTDISKFEKNENIALNMLGYKCDFYLWRISKEKNRTHINLLLISDEHYCLINNMSRLLSSQTSKDEKARVFSWLLFSKGTEKVFMDKIKLVSRKGVYPYDYTDSITKFDVTELPPKDKFYSKLNDCDISNEDYEHTQNLWN